MIDIRYVEMVEPNLERTTLIEKNDNLKKTVILLATCLIILAGIYVIKEIHDEKRK